MLVELIDAHVLHNYGVIFPIFAVTQLEMSGTPKLINNCLYKQQLKSKKSPTKKIVTKKFVKITRLVS